MLINYSKSEAEAKASEVAYRDAGADTLLVQGDVAQDVDCKALAQAAVARWGRRAGQQRWRFYLHRRGQLGCAGRADVSAHFGRQRGGVVPNGARLRAAPQDSGRWFHRQHVVDAGSLGIGSSVPYIASKGAVNAMALCLARALAPEIRVNAVCPSLITSRWFVDGIGQEGFEKIKATYERTAPLGRPCTPEDVAEAVVWLVDGARTVTGELVLLDSGMHLGGKVSVPGKT